MNKNSEPLYEQIKIDIRTKIIDRFYSPMTRLPSEAELEKEYGASRITIRRAIQDLADDGYLIKRPGLGTFVASKKEERKIINIVSFYKECREKGIDLKTKIVKKEIISARKKDNSLLGIPTGDPVVYIERVRYIDNKPVIIDKSFFPISYKWLLEMSDDRLSSLSELLAECSSEKEVFAKYRIELSYATGSEAKLLECKVNAPVFFLSICTFNDKMKALNRSEQLLVGDRFSIDMVVPFDKE